MEFLRLVEQRPQQAWRDLRVDLEVIHAGDGMLIDRAPCLVRRRDARCVGIGRRRALERDDAIPGDAQPFADLAATGNQHESQQNGRPAVRPSGRHFESDDVWSCKIRQRSPCRWSTKVNGPLATTESPFDNLNRAVAYAKSGVSTRTRSSSNESESRDFPGAK